MSTPTDPEQRCPRCVPAPQELSWEHDTRIIRRWLSGGTVPTQALAQQLRMWADAWACSDAPGPVVTKAADGGVPVYRVTAAGSVP